MKSRFDRVNPRMPFPELEEKVLEFWRQDQVFKKSLEARQEAPEFIFYEGPPTANGNPGIHHVQARAYKDLFPRYKTMRGFRVRRKAGWDCHGLPVEIEVEKRLGFSGKQAIEQYGIEAFNRQCRESVMTYEGAWRSLTERIAFWVDLDDAYMTMSNNYVESVWWSLKRLWEKDLLYLGYKVVPYCARCGTPLSTAEVGLGYQDVEDPSIYVRFPLEDPTALGLPAGASLLVWTTTPWTLPGNTGAAVHPTMEYVAVQRGDETLVLAECRVESALGAEPPLQVLRRLRGADLEGARYHAPYRWFDFAGKDGHRVVLGDFVTTEDGSGIVHLAPAFGADDLEVGRRQDLPVVHSVKPDGHFHDEAGFLAGAWFKDADPQVIQDLRDRGLMFRVARHVHSYPHCWRCSNPLMYYATDSWFIRNTSLKDRLIQKNQEIDWHPGHIKTGRYGDWLNNLVDWALSRSRYWGTPLPLWECGSCDHREAIGSFRELARRSRTPLDVEAPGFDPHRPYVDEVVFDCPECHGDMRRVSDVIDCWYDSGSMPFAQLHYPFENKELFESSFPADFICEGLDQTRGWFNSLHQIGVMVFDSIAYRTVICHGLVLDENGEKMSKSRGNVVNPWDVLNAHGADALRWYLYTSAPPEHNRRFSVGLVGEASRHLNTWWNTWQFFLLNVNAAEVDLGREVPYQDRTELDRWILARLHATIRDVTEALDEFDPTRSARALESLVDDLSNWYVRRSRRRFWDSDPAAYRTLYECLVTLARLQAPFTPFLAEASWRNLVPPVDPGAQASVHLADWPLVDESLLDTRLMEDAAATQAAVSVGRAARNASKQKVRQPLAEVLIRPRSAREREGLERFSEHVLDELNVKTLRFLGADEPFLDYGLKPNLPVLGPRFGKKLGGIRRALQEADARQVAGLARRGEEIPLSVDGETLTLASDDVLVEVRSPEGYSAEEDAGLMVAVATTITEELRLEGLARDVVRHIQELRKTADFEISDRIQTWITGAWDELRLAVETHRQTISEETLSLEISFAEPPPEAVTTPVELVRSGPAFGLGVRRRASGG